MTVSSIGWMQESGGWSGFRPEAFLAMLFHRDALGQIPGLVDLAVPQPGDMVGEKLEGDHGGNGGD